MPEPTDTPPTAPPSDPIGEFASVTIFGRSIPTREFQGVRYIAMRPLVEALGLAWKPQFVAIKGRNPAARVIPFRDGNGRYRRLLGLPLGEVNEWAYSVNLKKIRSEPAIQNLLDYQVDLDLDAYARSRRAVVEARVMRLGEKYRDLPLCQAEAKLLDDMRETGRALEAISAILGYGNVLGAARAQLDRMLSTS